MISHTLRCYRRWTDTASPEAIRFVDSIYAYCEEHYEAGGSNITECFSPEEIIEEFKTLDEARAYCGIRVEQALNCRWGEDTDPELATSDKFEQWEKESGN